MQDKKRSSGSRTPRGDMSRRYKLLSDIFFFLFLFILRYVLARVPLLRRAFPSNRSRDRPPSSIRKKRNALPISRHGEEIFIYLSSLSSCFSSRFRSTSAVRDCDYYVRMHDPRSCCHIVCILLVARNRFVIRWIKTAEMKTKVIRLPAKVFCTH